MYDKAKGTECPNLPADLPLGWTGTAIPPMQHRNWRGAETAYMLVIIPGRDQRVKKKRCKGRK